MEGQKETNEEEHVPAASSEDQQLPIMHWDDLSQRIDELEKQERRAKRGAGLQMDVWEEEDHSRRRRATSATSRFHRNLQLCFTNNADSDEEEQGKHTKVSMGTGSVSPGLKQEVASALRTLRDELLAEEREKECLTSSCVAKRKHLERWELQECSVQQLNSMRASLQQDVYALSSELVSHLLVRDQLRTKQDAMLLDVQDLT